MIADKIRIHSKEEYNKVKTYLEMAPSIKPFDKGNGSFYIENNDNFSIFLATLDVSFKGNSRKYSQIKKGIKELIKLK